MYVYKFVRVCVWDQRTAFTFAEMGFSKIESKHKSQHAKGAKKNERLRQTSYKSHTVLLRRMADTSARAPASE